ncbi:hypothetical protein BD324DRAFT_616012 [Kockovaella imperatae]|uniref:FAD-binding PCMH-type domain-containing protein n=1 Tax=Kockovaella imperatae TaxID=4999 RepID=A0A1Y1URG1_9TREE|nr:hypothetical protein BD324DRAFT_616012 [Kockovaella imperatae]ORX40036.1 hypothetical protein BD324DRAFT_616012 [Kockovaella imperatae]
MTVNQDMATLNPSSPETSKYPFTGRPATPLASGMTSGRIIAELRETLGTTTTQSGPQVWGREDDQFKRGIVIFNGAVKSPAVALVQPLNAEDVSQVIKYCRQNGLEISVKAGGTGVHGWSVAGHVIIDLEKMNEITVHKPGDTIPLEESFSKLRLDASHGDNVTPNVPKRPSLSTTNPSNPLPSPEASGLKRGSQDEGQEGHDSKRRMDTIDRANRSLSDPTQEAQAPCSSASPSGSGSGSNSSRPSASRSGSHPTPATSLDSDHRSGEGKDPSPSVISPSTSSSRSNSHNGTTGARVTYVNPSPTTATSHPFVTPPFGPETPSSSTFSTTSPSLGLNTNPNPPEYTIVTFGAGINSKQLDMTTARTPYGAFHVPTSAFPVGSGQFMLGGFGFMGRQYGLAMDNVVEAEIVLADGRIVWVGEGGKHAGQWKKDEDPNDLWWALRGAGSIMGIITRFRAKAHYLPSVYAGNLIYVFDRQTTPSLLRHVRDVLKGSPKSQYTNIIMTAGPPGAPAIVVFQLCCSGTKAEGEAYLQAISSWEGGRCLFQDFSERTFERQQLAVEEILKGGKGKKWYIKSDMLMGLDDEVIDNTCARFSLVPDGCTWLFEYTGGSVSSGIKDSCYPQSHRQGAFTVAALHQWAHTEPLKEDNKCVTTAEEWINEVIHPHSPGGPLPCFLQSSKEADVAGVFGENYPRLGRVKAMFDPSNFFKHSFWPRPGSPGDERQLGKDTAEGVQARELMNGALEELPPEDTTIGKGKGKERLESGQDMYDRIPALKAVATVNGASNGVSNGSAATEDSTMEGVETAGNRVKNGVDGTLPREG